MNFNRNEREQEIVIETLTFQLEEERKRRILAENKLHETEKKLKLSEMQKTELKKSLSEKKNQKKLEAKAVKAVIEDIEFPTLHAALFTARCIKRYIAIHNYITANEILCLCGYQCLAAVNGNAMGEYGWLAERIIVRQHLDKNGVPDGTWCLGNLFDPLPIYQLEFEKRFGHICHSY